MKKKLGKKFLQVMIFVVGTYSERLSTLLHTLIIKMNPTLFSFICVIAISIILTELTNKY